MENTGIPDPNLASELRQSAGREWNEEAAEDERLTEVHRRRNLTLADQAKELVNRGDRVSVDFGGHTFSGAVAWAGQDFVTIHGPGQNAEVRLDTARWSVLTTDQRAEPGAPGPESFMAALHQHTESNQVIRLTLPGGDMVIGKLAVVADDHVEMNDVDERRLIVPMRLILGVVMSSDFQ